MIRNKLLLRQVKRSFGVSDPEAVARLADDAGRPGLGDLLHRVEDSYDQYERDIHLRTRSLEISSEELHTVNRRLKQEIDASQQALDHLRRSAAELLARAGLTDRTAVETDTLEGLSRLIGELIGQRLSLEESLRASERRFRDLTGMSTDWFWEQDAQLRFTTMSGGLYRSLLEPEATLGKTRRELPIVGVSAAEWRAHEQVLALRLPFHDFVYQIETQPGHLRWFSVSGKPIWGGDGIFLGYRGIGQDITERKRAEDELRLAASVFGTSAEGVMVTDAEARILAVNPAFEAITGYRRDDVIGQTPRILASGLHDAEFYPLLWSSLAKTGRWQGEIWDRRKTGEIYAISASISAIRDEHGDVCRYVSVFSDISERKQAEERINYLAQHDVLTGLPNRLLMEDRLSQAIHQAERAGASLALLFVDLDRFKNINDSLGHHVGDLVLREVAQRLSACVRKSDTVCRLGGDEFLVVLCNMSASEDAARIANKILASLSAACLVDGHQLHVTPSIGISIFPQDGNDPVTLMKNADAAMYHAKRNGRNLVQFFTQELNSRVSERLALENHLRRAIDNQEFELYYQPQICVQRGRILGVEALVRWRHPDWGMVSPVRFIPIAEESGLIIALGRWILRTACCQARRWQQLGCGVPVAVNISAVQFHHEGFLAEVTDILMQSGLPPAFLELELTEGVVMGNTEENTERLQQVKQVGISLAIDDFGTGYSSLSYLKRFPIDKLKIDRSFVSDLVDNHTDAEIVKAIIALGRSLGLRVIAEGVENAAQLQKLQTLGANEYQGYLYQPPVPATVIEQLLFNERVTAE